MDHINLPHGTLAPVSPYCHAVRAGDLLFVTGQLAQDPAINEIQQDSIEDQTRRVMENLKLVLEEANSSFDQVVTARVSVTDMRYLSALNPVYASYFSTGHIPGRTAIGVTGLAGLSEIEIDLIAYCGIQANKAGSSKA